MSHTAAVASSGTGDDRATFSEELSRLRWLLGLLKAPILSCLAPGISRREVEAIVRHYVPEVESTPAEAVQWFAWQHGTDAHKSAQLRASGLWSAATIVGWWPVDLPTEYEMLRDIWVAEGLVEVMDPAVIPIARNPTGLIALRASRAGEWVLHHKDNKEPTWSALTVGDLAWASLANDGSESAPMDLRAWVVLVADGIERGELHVGPRGELSPVADHAHEATVAVPPGVTDLALFPRRRRWPDLRPPLEGWESRSGLPWSEVAPAFDATLVPELFARSARSDPESRLAFGDLVELLLAREHITEAGALAVELVERLVVVAARPSVQCAAIALLIDMARCKPDPAGQLEVIEGFDRPVDPLRQWASEARSAVVTVADRLVAQAANFEVDVQEALLGLAHCANQPLAPDVLRDFDDVAAAISAEHLHAAQATLAFLRGQTLTNKSFGPPPRFDPDRWASVPDSPIPPEQALRGIQAAGSALAARFPLEQVWSEMLASGRALRLSIDPADGELPPERHCVRRLGSDWVVYYSDSTRRLAAIRESTETSAAERLRHRLICEPGIQPALFQAEDPKTASHRQLLLCVSLMTSRRRVQDGVGVDLNTVKKGLRANRSMDHEAVAVRAAKAREWLAATAADTSCGDELRLLARNLIRHFRLRLPEEFNDRTLQIPVDATSHRQAIEADLRAMVA